jgi:hypothetical protein
MYDVRSLMFLFVTGHSSLLHLPDESRFAKKRGARLAAPLILRRQASN